MAMPFDKFSFLQNYKWSSLQNGKIQNYKFANSKHFFVNAVVYVCFVMFLIFCLSVCFYFIVVVFVGGGGKGQREVRTLLRQNALAKEKLDMMSKELEKKTSDIRSLQDRLTVQHFYKFKILVITD